MDWILLLALMVETPRQPGGPLHNPIEKAIGRLQGRVFGSFIRPGMSGQQVERLLGEHTGRLSVDWSTPDGKSVACCSYCRYGLLVVFTFTEGDENSLVVVDIDYD